MGNSCCWSYINIWPLTVVVSDQSLLDVKIKIKILNMSKFYILSLVPSTLYNLYWLFFWRFLCFKITYSIHLTFVGLIYEHLLYSYFLSVSLLVRPQKHKCYILYMHISFSWSLNNCFIAYFFYYFFFKFMLYTLFSYNFKEIRCRANYFSYLLYMHLFYLFFIWCSVSQTTKDIFICIYIKKQSKFLSCY